MQSKFIQSLVILMLLDQTVEHPALNGVFFHVN